MDAEKSVEIEKRLAKWQSTEPSARLIVLRPSPLSLKALPQWSIVIGNLLAAAMLGVFGRRHRVTLLEFLLADE